MKDKEKTLLSEYLPYPDAIGDEPPRERTRQRLQGLQPIPVPELTPSAPPPDPKVRPPRS